MSAPYGMPPAGPLPPAAPQKSRTGLYVGIACGCLLLIALLIAAGGVGLWLFSGGGGQEDPTARPTTVESSPEDPSEDPSGEPTDEETSADPLETPSEEPSEDPTSEAGASFEITVSPPEEGTTLDTGTDTLETTNGKYVGVKVIIANTGDEDIGMSLDSFSFVDVDGTEYRLMHGVFSTISGIAPGEEGEALLYADVPADAELESVTYTDAVGTAGERVEFAVGG